jgi:putative ABC transport system substrate-binding protein
MNLKTVGIVLIIAAICVGSFVLFKKKKQEGDIIIGILQTASHPALDAAREGFVRTVKDGFGDRVSFIIKNAQGSIVQAHTIAESFHANPDIDAFFAIATPAAQSLGLKEKERPIFLAAVTDPSALNLIHPTTNVTGSSDKIDNAKEVDMLVQLLPQAKTVAILFCSAESNSRIAVDELKKELQRVGLTALEVAFTNDADMPAAITSAVNKADVILTPNDNAVSSAIQFIATTALNHKKPLIVSDNLLVKHGALAARGIDYEKSGEQAGHAALNVLQKGMKPFQLPVEKPLIDTVVINKKTADILNITIPQTLSDRIELVGE